VGHCPQQPQVEDTAREMRIGPGRRRALTAGAIAAVRKDSNIA
jgi:hypothetical protein